MLSVNSKQIHQTPDPFGLTRSNVPLELPCDLESEFFRRRDNELKGPAKRDSDFRAGRYCAALALSKFGLNSEVPMGVDRCPVWPQGTTGSISHSRNFAWAVVGRVTEYLSLGIDTEPIADLLTLNQLWNEILVEREERHATRLGFGQQQAFTLIFSAKESVYKCVYQIDGQFFGFHDVRVASMNKQVLILRMNSDNPSSTYAGRELTVHYRVTESDVYTACWLTNPGSGDR